MLVLSLINHSGICDPDANVRPIREEAAVFGTVRMDTARRKREESKISATLLSRIESLENC